MIKFPCIPAILFSCLLAGQAAAQFSAGSLGKINLGYTALASTANMGASALPVCGGQQVSCSAVHTYTFVGNGAWTNEANWIGNNIPPSLLPAGAVIFINPESGGECIVNVAQTISAGANLHVLEGKRMRILFSLIYLK